MSLKELTAHKHRDAEQSAFMKRLIEGVLPRDIWADFLFQKTSFYGAMEQTAEKLGILNLIPDLRRRDLIVLDFESVGLDKPYSYNSVAIEYTDYINSLEHDVDKFMAHVYTWHLGDLYGGQIIKTKAPGPCQSLQYSDPQGTAQKIRTYLKDSMAPEVCKSFDYSIKLMEQYEL